MDKKIIAEKIKTLYDIPKDLLVKLIMHINDLTYYDEEELKDKKFDIEMELRLRQDKSKKADMSTFARKKLLDLKEYDNIELREFLTKYEEYIKTFTVANIHEDYLYFDIKGKAAFYQKIFDINNEREQFLDFFYNKKMNLPDPTECYETRFTSLFCYISHALDDNYRSNFGYGW